MARKQDKKAGKLPKRIAGTKIPKALRKTGALAAEWLASPTGRQLVASTLIAAAAALAGGDRKVRRAVKGDAGTGAARMGQALAGAAVDVIRRTLGEGEPAAAKPAAPKPRRKNRPGTPTFTH